MGELACPQCGNPNLDVDEQNSIVSCKKCGFAVQVDPKTGEAIPLSQGAPQGRPGTFGVPSGAYAKSDNGIFGIDPLTFWLGGVAILMLLYFLAIVTDFTTLGLLFAIITAIWWFKK